MTLKELIENRHSIRKFKDTPVPDEDVLEIIDAIRRGPSSENEQPWHFVIVRNQDFKDKLAALIKKRQEELSAEVAVVNEKLSKRFEKFIRLFTLFSFEASVLVMVFSTRIPNGATREFKTVGRPVEDLEDLQLMNPGMMSLGACLENGVLTLNEMGYGTTIMTSQSWCHKDIEELVREEIGYETRPGWFLACMFPIGVPEGEPKSPGRRPVEDIVTFFN